MIKAVIFDMDGVLINSEITYIKLLQNFLKESGVILEQEELYFLAGSSKDVEEKYIANKLGLSVKEANIKENEYFKKHPVDYKKIRKEYVVEILDYLKNKGIVIALASSSSPSNIEEVLSQCEINEYFTYKISGHNFKKTKPDPEIYEYTVNKLGFEKEEIIVIEDSSYGIEAASKAGLKVLAVLDPILCFDTSKATATIKTLQDVKTWI